MLAERRDPTNLLFMPTPRKEEPEPEPVRRHSLTDTTITRMVESVRAEMAGQFGALRQEIEADVGEVYEYISNELSAVLKETFNTIADEFEHTRLDIKALQSKFLENDVSNLQSENAALRNDVDALKKIVEGLAYEVAQLRDDIAGIERGGGGKIVALRGSA